MTNKEFKTLMNLKKSFVKDSITLPANTEKETFEIKSLSTKDEFFLDIDRGGRIELSKFKLQNRYAKTKQPLVQILPRILILTEQENPEITFMYSEKPIMTLETFHGLMI